MAIAPEEILGKSNEILQKERLEMNSLETEIYTILLSENLSIDEISLKINMDIVQVTSTLTIMELKGIVNDVGGKFYLSRT